MREKERAALPEKISWTKRWMKRRLNKQLAHTAEKRSRRAKKTAGLHTGAGHSRISRCSSAEGLNECSAGGENVINFVGKQYYLYLAAMAGGKVTEVILWSNGDITRQYDMPKDSSSLSMYGNNRYLSAHGNSFNGSVEDFHDETGVVTVDFILKKRRKLKYLLETEILEHIDDWWHFVYLLAASAGCEDIVSLLIERGVFVDFLGVKGRSALHFAASAGHYKIVKLLLENSSSPYILDADGKTPLCLASENGHQRVIRLLAKTYDVIPEMEILNESSDPDLFKKMCNMVEKTIRMQARREFWAQKRTKELASHPDEVTWREREQKLKSSRERAWKRRPRKQRTKSVCAVGFNLENITSDVYEYVAECRSDCVKGCEKFDSNATQSITGCQITEELLSHLIFLSRGGESCLHVASKLGFAEVLPGLVREECDVNCCDWNGETALRKAVWNGHDQCVKTLLQFGASVETLNPKFDPPTLHLAVINSHTKCIEHILERGADVNFCDKNGQTALHASSKYGDRKCATILLKHGADTSCLDKRGNTALHLAAKHGNEESILALVDGGAEVDSLDNNGQTPLHLAAFWGHVACMSLLLDRGAKLRSEDECGNSALHFAARNNQDEALFALVHRGADVNSQNNEQQTPLHISALEGHVPCCTVLIEAGAKLEIRNGDGLNALHITASRGHLVCILLLLEGGANVNSCDMQGLTALHHTCERGFEECVTILLDNGADIDREGKFGITALNIADSRGHMGCISICWRRRTSGMHQKNWNGISRSTLQ
ncbi:E3 ubiquitin-protein ligase mind-bomb [Gryllus bimaculatus]|nr:E3 ubiquitin-protein ligase mind-bomb [Gryllus bimaculatus]